MIVFSWEFRANMNGEDLCLVKASEFKLLVIIHSG